MIIEPNPSNWETWLQKWFLPLLIPAILVNAGGLLIPILEPDGSLYATIAKSIARTGDFVNLRVDGKDWLDKPHFPFWMAALSFRLLGVNAFAYKFPALLFWAAGGWYTWRLALSLYGKTVAQLSVLIYVSAAHLVISNNDVRAEPYLTGLIIGSVYHFYRASRTRPGIHLVAGSLLAGCACMTKGPFVLITIGAGFVLDWSSGKEWEQFRNPRWWIAIALTALFTLPEIYCLYLQFDLHPEKLVFGRTGVSGIRFFFWDSQFGRFFNTGPIKGSGDPFFYFHTVLWAFLPWSLLLYAAIVQKCRRRRAFPGDLLCLGAALASFIVFSLSRFQLPHYLNILFPFFSILTAAWLYSVRRRGSQQAIRIAQNAIAILLPILLLALCWLFHFNGWVSIMTAIGLLAIAPFLLFRRPPLPASIVHSFWMALLVFCFVNFILYPAILQYQAGTVAGHYLRDMPPPAQPVYLLQEAPVDYSFEFDCPHPVERIPIDSLATRLRQTGAAPQPALVFAPTSFADTLERHGYRATPLHSFPNFHISQLTGRFADYRTRTSVLTQWSLLRVRK
ncbi:MAG TPA: glycosyltransferase family 39 protein [Puia sp.]|uniref:ArnT family glycosyltransferase n=1 Tax=Puia sp. TaxID=2045100 RepID=UPI002D18A81D|nr:glycosyltransferase family 39 protein [Puia sp.]HVU99042.1 glycosyltransferase family 39 protein [Puia sp.]